MKEEHPLIKSIKLKKLARKNGASPEFIKKIDDKIAGIAANCLQGNPEGDELEFESKTPTISNILKFERKK